MFSPFPNFSQILTPLPVTQHPFFLTHQTQFVLHKYSQVSFLPLEHVWLTRCCSFRGNWLSQSQHLPVARSTLSRGEMSCPTSFSMLAFHLACTCKSPLHPVTTAVISYDVQLPAVSSRYGFLYSPATSVSYTLCTLFQIIPEPWKGWYSIDVQIRCEHLAVSCSLHLGQLCCSVLIIILCR